MSYQRLHSPSVSITEKDGEKPIKNDSSELSNFDIAIGVALIVATGLLGGLLLKPQSSSKPPWNYVSNVLGWLYFACWTASFYPQVAVNYRRKSVVGISFDYQVFNIVGYTCYSTYTINMLWNPNIREAYRADHQGHPPAVQLADVCFAVHGLFITLVTVAQIIIYERGGQKVSKLCWLISALMVLSSIIFSVLVESSSPHHSFPPARTFTWLNFLYFLSGLKVAISSIKYTPQVLLNWRRKSTTGVNIHNFSLDMSGGLLSLVQLVLDSWLQNDWSAITGNLAKFLLGSIALVYDSIFLAQHYICYRGASAEPLV